MSFLLDFSSFSSCMYQYGEKEEFEKPFDAMSEKSGLDDSHLLKHKWAECYMLGAKSKQTAK